MIFSRDLYNRAIHAQNDFLGAIGFYEYHIISSVPGTTLNYASIIQPFDATGWGLIATSAISVLVLSILINEVSVRKLKKMKMSIHKSTHKPVYTYYHMKLLTYHLYVQ